MATISGKNGGTVKKAYYGNQVIAMKDHRMSYGVSGTECTPEALFHAYERMNSLQAQYCVQGIGVVYGREKEPRWLAMEYMVNGSLADMLRENFASLSSRDKAEIAWCVCKCLRLVHNNNRPMVLGKIGSHKLLIGDNREVKLYDFTFTDNPDMAKRYLHKKNREYIPPEQLTSERDKYRQETELYGLGIIVWEIATGKPPSEAKPLPADCPEAFKRVTSGLKHNDPSQRMSVKALSQKDSDGGCHKCTKRSYRDRKKKIHL
ncbi:mixed lineage kinase domain-like protein [Ptychodera flava]|uniref:mixed lineage kinase domain-like protein n=1 Tax=Ptychodera flava TaxID=63121 RepID=UPI00396A64B8